MRQNTKSVLVRLTDAEYDRLKALSTTTGIKREPLIRQLIMGVQLRPRPPDEYADLLRELSAIGNNVNQLAYWANARRDVSSAEIHEAALLVQQAFSLVKETL